MFQYKGMRDYSERETALRNRILNAITNVFELYGAVTIDTPTVELKVWAVQPSNLAPIP